MTCMNDLKSYSAVALAVACLAGAGACRRPGTVMRSFESQTFGSPARLDQVAGQFSAFGPGKGVSWTDDGTKFTVTEAAAGDFVYRMGRLSNPDSRITYRPGDPLHGVVLVVSVERDGSKRDKCVEIQLRRDGGGGEKLAPNNGNALSFPVPTGSNCFGDPDTTYPGQFFVFVAPEKQKAFTFLTGADPAEFKLKMGWSALTLER